MKKGEYPGAQTRFPSRSVCRFGVEDWFHSL